MMLPMMTMRFEVGNWAMKKKARKKKVEQSDPPRIGLSKLYPDGIYPEGEIQLYKDECVIFFYRFVRTMG